MIDAYLLRPRPPFGFDQALAFLRRFPPTLGERAVVDGEVLGAARLGGQTVGFRLVSEGAVEAPSLRCTVSHGDGAAGSVYQGRAEALLTRLGEWLGLDDDLGPFYTLAEGDPPFWTLVGACTATTRSASSRRSRTRAGRSSDSAHQSGRRGRRSGG